MRVLYVTANSYLRSTTSSLNAILTELRPRGLQPVMVFRDRGPWQERLSADGVPCYFDELEVPTKSKPVSFLAATLRLARIVRRHRIELIHCNEQDHYPAMRAIARWMGIPIITTVHSAINASWGKWAFRSPYAPAAIQFLSRAQLEATRPALPTELPASCLKLLMSGLAVDELLAAGTESDRDTIRRRWGVGSGGVVFGTASAIKPHKHLDDFVDIIGRLRHSGLDATGVIAGGAPFIDPVYAEHLVQHIRHEGLTEHCLLIGNLDPVQPFLRGIDVAINTSEMEILSMSICEAMAFGKPAIAYAVGGNPEAVHDAWCVVPYGDIDALADRAAKLVDADFRREMGKAAARHIREHFDAPALAERQAATYEEILGYALQTVRASDPGKPRLTSAAG